MPERARFSSAHCRRTDKFSAGRSTIALRSGILIARASCQEIPFNRQLANLGIKLRRLALVLLLAIPQSARAAREKARHVVENLLLPAIDLVRVNAVPLRQLRHRRYLAQCLQGNPGLECRIKLLA